jgi:putative transposase
MHEQALPPDAMARLIQKRTGQTLAGILKTSREVLLEELILPEFAQEVMESIFCDMPDVKIYIDDIGIWAQSWDHHQELVAKVLERLKANGFSVNPLKCKWAIQETDWLGYWLTPKGLKPWKKKVDGILKMQLPQTVKQIRSFIGAVSFYRDMFSRRSHHLAPLTNLTGKGCFVWTPEH